MKLKTNALAIFLLLLTAPFSFAQTKEKKKVRKTYEEYKAALLSDNGERASNLVDSRTIKYYDDMLGLVKTGDSATVDALPVLDKIMVFVIRHRVAREDILRFDGKAVFAEAVKKGMIDKSSAANNAIGEIVVTGDFAMAQILVDGKVIPSEFYFYKENKQWKINLTSIFTVSSIAIKKIVEDSGQSENEFIFTLLEYASQKRPGPEIWKPVK